MRKAPFVEVTNGLGCPSFILSTISSSRACLTIIVKGTFEFDASGKVLWAQDQIPVAEWDEYDDPIKPKVVLFESDLIRLKPCTDIVLVGKAHAPAGSAVEHLLVTLRVGKLVSSIKVFGNRYWAKKESLFSRLMISEPRPFTAMELTYQRAFGGVDCDENWKGEWSDENPVGVGFIARGRIKEAQGKPLPNLEDPDNLIRKWSDRPHPVGYGFYGRGWKPRVEFCSLKSRGAVENPEDSSDPRFGNAAHPRLQYPGYLRGSEDVELINLTSERPHVSFALPGITPLVKIATSNVCRTDSVKNCEINYRALTVHLDTLCFLPDEGRFYQVWRCTELLAANEKVVQIMIGK